MKELPVENLYRKIQDRRIETRILYCIQNGFYIPFLNVFLYLMTNNAFLSSAVALKLYSTNYYYWFGEHYDYMPKKLNWIKQFVRFTDSGHIASFIYVLYPDFLPIAYNIHFTITFGYWLGKLSFDSMDKDVIFLPELHSPFQKLWSAMNHSVPLLLLTHKLIIKDVCYHYFTWEDLKWSYYWLYVWFFCVYLTWRIATGDCVYRVLAYETPMKKKLVFIFLINGILFLGNTTGYLLC